MLLFADSRKKTLFDTFDTISWKYCRTISHSGHAAEVACTFPDGFPAIRRRRRRRLPARFLFAPRASIFSFPRCPRKSQSNRARRDSPMTLRIRNTSRSARLAASPIEIAFTGAGKTSRDRREPARYTRRRPPLRSAIRFPLLGPLLARSARRVLIQSRTRFRLLMRGASGEFTMLQNERDHRRNHSLPRNILRLHNDRAALAAFFVCAPSYTRARV